MIQFLTFLFSSQAQEARTALLRERASQRLGESGGLSRSERDADDQGQNGEIVPTVPPSNNDEQDMRFGIALGSLKDVVQPDGHVNFFQDVEAGKRQGGTTNEEHEEEKKKEQEDYEKKIGYLVYLGQDSLEHSKNKPWYANIDRGNRKEGLDKELEKEKDLDSAAGRIGGLEEKSKTISIEDIKKAKSKSLQDPLQDIRKYLSTPGVKRKLEFVPSSSKSKAPAAKKSKQEEKKAKKEKRKKHKNKSKKKHKHHKKHSKKHSKSVTSSDTDSGSSESEDDKKKKLEDLRRQRLQREREERRKAEQVLAKLRGEEIPVKPAVRSSSNSEEVPSMASVKQKYNSQFNPHLARQNFE